MSTYNEKQKEAIYKWREKNRERYNKIMRDAKKKYTQTEKAKLKKKEANKRYREKHREELREKARQKRMQKKENKI